MSDGDDDSVSDRVNVHMARVPAEVAAESVVPESQCRHVGTVFGNTTSKAACEM